jgi:hypothetical protein
MHERGLQLPKVVGQQHDFLMVAIDTGNVRLAYEEDLEDWIRARNTKGLAGRRRARVLAS